MSLETHTPELTARQHKAFEDYEDAWMEAEVARRKMNAQWVRAMQIKAEERENANSRG